MIRLLIIIVLVIVVLSLLGVNISSLINNQTLKQNIQIAWELAGTIWNNYLKEPFQNGLSYLADTIFGSDVKTEGQNESMNTTDSQVEN